MSIEEKSKEITELKEVGDAVLMTENHAEYSDHIQIFVEGRKYKTTFTKKFLERKQWKAPNPNEIISHIPGSVASILVKKGEKVKKGDKLMIYEAMKMKNIVTAPFDAMIKSIESRVGDKLPKGALLMTLIPDEPKTDKKQKKKKIIRKA